MKLVAPEAERRWFSLVLSRARTWVVLVLGLWLGALAVLGSHGVSEGNELRLLLRARALSATDVANVPALAWGTKPLEGLFPAKVVALGLGLGTNAESGILLAKALFLLLAASAVAATYALVRASSDALAARAAVIVLATLPIFVVHASALLPDLLTFSAVAVAFAAFALAAEPHLTLGLVKRGALVLVGALAVALGVACRGWLAGALVPLAPLIVRAYEGLPEASRSHEPPEKRGLWALRVGVSLVAALVLVRGARELLAQPSFVASAVTFDAPLASAMHALFPWSAVLPLAWSSLARGDRGRAGVRSLRASVLVGLALAYAVGLAAARAGATVPFVAPSLVAVAVGLTVRDLDASRERAVSPRACLASLVFALLLARDAWLFPEGALAPFSGGALPSAVLPRIPPLVSITALTLVTGLVVLTLPRLGLLRLVPAGTWLLGWGAAGALLFVFVHHRAVLDATSVQGAMKVYHAHGSPEARLGLAGVSPEVALFAGDEATETFAEPDRAAEWLATSGGARRFVLAKAELRARLDAPYRARTNRHLFELEVPGPSDSLLFVSDPRPDEHNRNPLGTRVLDALPSWAKPLHASFDLPVSVEGVGFLDGNGKPIQAISPGESLTVTVVYRARGVVPGGHCSFVHVDTRPIRGAFEDRELRAYPMHLWRDGDFVVVEHVVPIPRGAAKGRAEVSFGLGVLPCSDDRRAHVVEGAHTFDRVSGGYVDVR